MTGGREVSPGMTGGGEVFVRNDVCVLIRHSFAAIDRGKRQGSPPDEAGNLVLMK
jgi:hypothetical protein